MGSPVSDEDWQKFSQGREVPSAPADASWLGDIGSGLAKGTTRNVAGLATAASKIPGLGFVAPSQAMTDWLNAPENFTESAADTAADYGSLMIPGLDVGLGAKFGAKAAQWALEHGPSIAKMAKVIGPDATRRMVHGLWDTLPKVGEGVTKGAIGGVAHDPEHPLTGAATGAAAGGAGMFARQAIPAAYRHIPQAARTFGKHAAEAATGFGAVEALRGGGFHGWFPGEYHLAYALPPAIAGLAALASGKPGALGALASSARRFMPDDSEETPFLPPNVTMPPQQEEPQPTEQP